MRRRTVLTALALLPVSGCTAPAENAPRAADSPTSTVTPDAADPILFVVRNKGDSERVVRLSIARGDTTLFGESAQLLPGEATEYDPEITAPGEYTVTVTVEGSLEWSTDHTIEGFDVRTGANHFIDVGADSVRMYWEE